MEKSQEIFIKARDSEYLHEIIQKKDWAALIELASSRNASSDLVFDFFRSDESKPALKDMTEEQILKLIDTAPVEVSNNILNRLESFCDTDSKFTDIAVKLMKGVYLHGGDLNKSSIVKCLPLNIIRVILDSRIPQTEFHFGNSLQEYFLHILSTLKPDSKQDYSYKNLKERDCNNGVYIYINDEQYSFPIGRREVFKEVIKSLSDCFTYIQSSTTLDYKSPYLRNVIIDPYLRLIVRGLEDSVIDYKNDKEIIELIQKVFEENYSSKYYLSRAHEPIISNNGNRGILTNSDVFENCKVISPNYYYKVFKKAVEDNQDNFIDHITRLFFRRCDNMHFIRELNDGVYDKLFNATIEMTVRELIEKKQSDNFQQCCCLLSHKKSQNFSNRYTPKLDECLNFVKSVIKKIFEKSTTLNVDVTAYPDICCYLLNMLNDEEIILPLQRNVNFDISYYIRQITETSHTPLDLLDTEMRNNLVLGVIRHPTDNTKFSHIITSNNPTTLVNFICQLQSVKDIKLILPESKRNSIDKYGFRESRTQQNPKEPCQMNLVEIFLHTLKFWENNDKSLFQDGYLSYYQFVKKIFKESILTDDKELKKNAINVYYRFSELVSLAKNAKYNSIRIRLASATFLDPLSIIVGSELDKSFVENYINKFIQPFNAQSYHMILSELISRSHLELNYYDDEVVDDEIDQKIFKKINIDGQMALATKLLLGCIKQNPVKKFDIYYNGGTYEDFFISKKRIMNFLTKKFELLNPKIIDVCNPLKTEYALDMSYNNPSVYPVSIREPSYKLSELVLLELCRFVQDEFKEYSPKMFKSNLTKSLIQIQNLIKSITKGAQNVFCKVFFLDEPKLDTSVNSYNNQSRNRINVLYSKPFFNFLNEIYSNNSIYNDEAYEIIKNAIIAQFLNEEDFLAQKNKPPPKFNGFDITIMFRNHQNADNIFNTKRFYETVKDYKLKVYQNANSLNQNLINVVERSYNNSKLLDEEPFDDVFNLDKSNHRSRELSNSQRSPYYRKNVHQCFVTIIDALNKCKAETFSNEMDSIDYLQNFSNIKDYGSSSSSYSMLTELFDLLINEFVSNKVNLSKTYKNRIVTYNDIYHFMCIVAQVASPNIGQLSNLQKLCSLNERTIAQKVPNRNPQLFESIFQTGNIGQIMDCMNSQLFLINSNSFYSCLLNQSGLVRCKEIINTLINEVSNNGKQVLDDFLVSLASCSIHPRFVGYPAPQSCLDFLKKITARSIYAKRAACANAIYYAIMTHMSDDQIPLKPILEIIELAHQKAPDEITAFFCLLISEDASIRKMSSLPALSDLMTDFALPRHYIIHQGPSLNIPKEIGELYYKVIENIILTGLKSKKSHIYELTVTVLNEINVGPEIHQIISPFIEKGLKEIEPSDDNEAFLTYATSFTMKNPEFESCFESYCECLRKIQKHSISILKANTHLNKDSPYPEPFKKLENSYSTVISTIEKPFIEFKEENEMISVSQFCRKLLPVLQKSRPAVARDVFLKLESYASIFGDEKVDEMVRLYKQDKKEESLSRFIFIVTHHEELVINIPQSVRIIYSHLQSSFTTKHSIELSRNLSDSQAKLPVSMQRANKLAEMISPDVLSHMPDEKSLREFGEKDENELVMILANLGIFCKKNEVAVAYTTSCSMADTCNKSMFNRMAANNGSRAAAPAGSMLFGSACCTMNAAPPPPQNPTCAPPRMTMFNAAPCAPAQMPMPESDLCDGGIVLEAPAELYNDVCVECQEAPAEAAVDDAVDDEEVEADENTGNESVEESKEDDGENELNQDQINDAFDLFF